MHRTGLWTIYVSVESEATRQYALRGQKQAPGRGGFDNAV